MTETSRDYKAEYARRIARGAAKGFSRSQARGHPKRRERLVSKKRPPQPIDETRLQIALKELRRTRSLSAAAHEAKISPERLRRYAKEKRLLIRRKRRWFVRKALPRQMQMFSDGRAIRIVVGDFASASKVGRYMSAVGRFLKSNDVSLLAPFEGQGIADVSENQLIFETRPNTLYRLASAYDVNFEHIYRIVV